MNTQGLRSATADRRCAPRGRVLLSTAAVLLTSAVQAEVSRFDAVQNMLTIPSVSVGATTFRNVTLLNTGNFVFNLQGASQEPMGYPGVASYDASSGVLTMPAVRVGDSTYLDVKLLNTGNFVFSLQAATEMPAGLMADIEAIARSVEAQTETAVSATGAERLALTDTCWASNGITRSAFIADYDSNIATIRERDAYLVGRRVRNIQVTALREMVNPDGSRRTEVDVEWDIVYRDGTTQRADKSTFIRGSSAGTPRCTTPQTGNNLRALGNQRLVAVSVRANNMRDERYGLTSGLPLSPAVMYRREMQFQITDPMGNATYVVMTGPGPTATVSNTVFPFSMKFLSPRLLRSAPELRGKPGNFLNWRDDDGFNNCRFADGSVPVAHAVDCVKDGATSNSWGWGYTSTPDAAADRSFAAQGWVAGAVYRFDVYNDDGWKTVNGQFAKTPIATYYAVADRLPYTFVEMANRYPIINLAGMSGAQLAASTHSATPAPLSLNWSRPTLAAGWAPMHLNQVWAFSQGPFFENAAGVFNPAYRNMARGYPGTTATSTTAFPMAAREPQQTSKTYADYTLFYSEPGSFHSIRSRLSLQ